MILDFTRFFPISFGLWPRTPCLNPRLGWSNPSRNAAEGSCAEIVGGVCSPNRPIAVRLGNAPYTHSSCLLGR
jgi:hypothetical protein